jgi:hypothetical protein
VTHYGVMVIGAGQGGGPLAGAFARAGWRTALIERVHVSRMCVNEGCGPTKTMVASARVAYLARRAADYGVRGSAVQVELRRVRERKQAIVDSFRAGSERALARTGAEVIPGQAPFTGLRTLEVSRDGNVSRRIWFSSTRDSGRRSRRSPDCTTFRISPRPPSWRRSVTASPPIPPGRVAQQPVHRDGPPGRVKEIALRGVPRS